jgi:hypothetical protein
MKKFLFVLVSCFFMLSCKKDDIKVYEFSKLFTALDTVDLETKEECIITAVTSLQTFNGNKWYVSEHYSLFLFDGEGKYLKKNGQRGNGPKEYSFIMDMKSDSNDNLVVYDAFGSKMSVLDSNLNYLGSRKIVAGDCATFYPIGNDYFFYNRNCFDDSLTLKVFDSSLTYKRSLVRFPYNSVMQVYLGGNKSFVYAKDINKILLTHLYDPFLKIVSLEKGHTINIIPLDFRLWRKVENEKVKKYFPELGSKLDEIKRYLYEKLYIAKILYAGDGIVLVIYKNRNNKEKYLQYLNIQDNKVNYIIKMPYDKEIALIKDNSAYFVKYNFEKEKLRNPSIIKYSINHDFCEKNLQ